MKTFQVEINSKDQLGEDGQVSLFKCISLSIIGFTIGGFLWGCLVGLYRDPFQEITFSLIGGSIFGLVGGLFLSILSKKKLKLIIYTTIGYAISGVMIFSPIGMLSGAILGIVGVIPIGFGIIVGGMFIGFALKRIKLFTILGALGYITGYFIFGLSLALLHYALNLNIVPMFTGLGIGTGIFLGLGMYLAEKQATNPQEVPKGKGEE